MENPWPFTTDKEAAEYFARVRSSLPYVVAREDITLLYKLSRHFDEKRDIR